MLNDLVDSMLTREDLEALLELILNKEPAGECEEFLRRSKNDEMDMLLPGLRSLSKIVEPEILSRG